MFERIGRGWGIAKASWAVIKLHPKLLLLPIFSGAPVLSCALDGARGSDPIAMTPTTNERLLIAPGCR